ncbi:hypothetical protein [Paraburkholderia ferrariae]|uniref:Uncharacterized protein n=1 Tax=Paraburkholderia ferrariae TaxID=386056 RepID=A0ABU9RMD3_9BURK
MKVDPYAQIVALARQQASEASHAAPNAGARASARKRTDGQRTPQFDLGRSIVERIREIAPDDPRRPRKAFRVFLEGVLAQEFGNTTLTDPGYQQLVDNVMEQMEAEPSLEGPLSRAINLLLGGATV